VPWRAWGPYLAERAWGTPLLAEIEALARSARVPLSVIEESPPPAAEALPGLTARELVVSEKTVSVHVSHLLHKTGTANRVELAQLARRAEHGRHQPSELH
jgi:Bacterial regulatory proteins, luxR family